MLVIIYIWQASSLSYTYSYKEHPVVKLADLDASIDTILKQINKVIFKDRFNHYRPANKLNQLGVDKACFKPKTLDNC